MNKVELCKYKNSDYYPGPKSSRILWYLISRIFFETVIPYPSTLKRMILRLFGCKCGHGIIIKPSVKIKYPWFLQLSNDIWIGENAWIDNLATVIMESNTVLSQGAMILTGNHNYKSRSFDLFVEDIIIKEGAWIGAKSLITSGVTIEPCSIICAGSVLTKSTIAYGIYQGNPAVMKNTRKIDE